MIASKSQQSIAPKRSGEKGEACNDVQSVHLEFQTVNKFISPVATRREKRIRSKGNFIIIFFVFLLLLLFAWHTVLMLCQIANSHALLPCVNRQNSAYQVVRAEMSLDVCSYNALVV